MKTSNYGLESALMMITAFLGLVSMLWREAILLGALWLIPLGIIQVGHSVVIASAYWNKENIRRMIIIYWCGVALNFIFMFVANAFFFSGDFELVYLLIFPLMLSFFLWYITYIFKTRPVTDKQDI